MCGFRDVSTLHGRHAVLLGCMWLSCSPCHRAVPASDLFAPPVGRPSRSAARQGIGAGTAPTRAAAVPAVPVAVVPMAAAALGAAMGELVAAGMLAAPRLEAALR